MNISPTWVLQLGLTGRQRDGLLVEVVHRAGELADLFVRATSIGVIGPGS